MKEDIRKQILTLVGEYSKQKFEEKIFIANESAVPVNGKVIDESELILMTDAVLDGWLTTGRFNDEFEKKLSSYLGVKHLITVNSGSSANLVAFSSLTSHKLKDKAIRPGDEVISVAAGFPTTINPIIQNGAVPVFVDVDHKTLNIDIDEVEKAITKKTKAIMIAHTLGNPFNLEYITDICKKHNLWLVEDNCDALGSRFDGKLTGTFGDIATLSFYPAHHITMGEGGAVFTNNDDLKTIAESMRDWGRDCYCKTGQDNTCQKRFEQKLGDLPYGYDHKFTYSHKGFNLKIVDTQAACGLAQLDKLEHFINSRKDNFNYLKDKLSSCEEYIYFAEPTENSDPSWFGFPITIKKESGFKRDDLVKFLNSKKIGTRLLFGGNITKQPYMAYENFRISGNLANTDNIMINTFWVGVYPGLSKEQLDFIVDSIESFFGVNF